MEEKERALKEFKIVAREDLVSDKKGYKMANKITIAFCIAALVGMAFVIAGDVNNSEAVMIVGGITSMISLMVQSLSSSDGVTNWVSLKGNLKLLATLARQINPNISDEQILENINKVTMGKGVEIDQKEFEKATERRR